MLRDKEESLSKTVKLLETKEKMRNQRACFEINVISSG